jgi:hypothetical protein
MDQVINQAKENSERAKSGQPILQEHRSNLHMKASFEQSDHIHKEVHGFQTFKERNAGKDLKDIRIGNCEIRFYEDGSVDEIIIRDSNGEGFFHLEQMDDNYFWARYTAKDDKSAIFWISSKEEIRITHEEE